MTDEFIMATCPSCGDSLELRLVDRLPNTGDPGMCTSCGTLCIWSGSAWRLSTQEERASLLQHQVVVDALTMQREMVAWKEADKERLTRICTTWLTVGRLVSQECLPDVLRDMVESLQAQGFHTHKLAGQ